MGKGNSKFLRKKPGDVVMEKVLDAASRASGALGGMYVSNTLLDKWTKKDAAGAEVPVIPKQYRGPALFVIGMAAEIFVEQPQIESLAQGIQVAGALEMMGEMVLKTPDKKAAYGLSGVGNNNNSIDVNREDSTSIDYDALYSRAFEESANMPEQNNSYQNNNYYTAQQETESSVKGINDEVDAHKLT